VQHEVLRREVTSAALAALSVILATACGSGDRRADPAVVDLGHGEGPVVARVASDPREPSAGRGAVAWTTDLAAGRARAEREGRPLLVFAHAAWSVPSERIARDLFTDARVVRASRAAVAVRLDFSDVDISQEVSDALGVRGVPTVMVLGPGGEERFRHVGTELDQAALVAALELD
jgi:thiol:disulfide interchange protein